MLIMLISFICILSSAYERSKSFIVLNILAAKRAQEILKTENVSITLKVASILKSVNNNEKISKMKKQQE